MWTLDDLVKGFLLMHNSTVSVCYLVSQFLCLSDFLMKVVEAVDQVLSIFKRFLPVMLQNVKNVFVRCRQRTRLGILKQMSHLKLFYKENQPDVLHKKE